MNEILNGTPLDKSIHVEGMVHDAYNAKVSLELQKIIDRYGDVNYITPNLATTEMNSLIERIRASIIANPLTNLNDLIF